MEIQPNLNLNRIGRNPATRALVAAKTDAADTASFSVASIDEALRGLPDVRPAEVSRAQGLVRQSTYPPPETIRKIAELLAIKFSEPETPASNAPN